MLDILRGRRDAACELVNDISGMHVAVPQSTFYLEKLRAEHEVDAWAGPVTIGREELLRRAAGADAVVSLLTERIDAELLDAAGPQLKVVANVAVGYDNIDVPACTERASWPPTHPGYSRTPEPTARSASS